MFGYSDQPVLMGWYLSLESFAATRPDTRWWRREKQKGYEAGCNEQRPYDQYFHSIGGDLGCLQGVRGGHGQHPSNAARPKHPRFRLV